MSAFTPRSRRATFALGFFAVVCGYILMTLVEFGLGREPEPYSTALLGSGIILAAILAFLQQQNRIACFVASLLALLLVDVGNGIVVNRGSMILTNVTGGDDICNEAASYRPANRRSAEPIVPCQRVPPLGRATIDYFNGHGPCWGGIIWRAQLHLRESAMSHARTCGMNGIKIRSKGPGQ
jgi:hypothetical protein